MNFSILYIFIGTYHVKKADKKQEFQDWLKLDAYCEQSVRLYKLKSILDYAFTLNGSLLYLLEGSDYTFSIGRQAENLMRRITLESQDVHVALKEGAALVLREILHSHLDVRNPFRALFTTEAVSTAWNVSGRPLKDRFSARSIYD